MDSNKLKSYEVWKADQHLNPIEGTDKFVAGFSKRDVLAKLANKEGVEIQHNDMMVNLPDNTYWCCSSFGLPIEN